MTYLLLRIEFSKPIPQKLWILFSENFRSIVVNSFIELLNSGFRISLNPFSQELDFFALSQISKNRIKFSYFFSQDVRVFHPRTKPTSYFKNRNILLWVS